MDRAAWLERLRAQYDICIALAADPAVDAAPVAVCPGWTGRDLSTHLGGVYRWVTLVLDCESGERPDRSSLPSRQDDQTSQEWLSIGFDNLVERFASLDDGTLRWNFLEGPGAPVGWWWRRQFHETAIHRVDYELAAGRSITDLDAGDAVDGIDEFLSLARVAEVPWDELDLGGAASVHMHATDAGGSDAGAAGPDGVTGEWTIDTGHNTLTHAHHKADVALRGPAWSLYRWCCGRLELSAAPEIETFGDVAAAEKWRPHL